MSTETSQGLQSMMEQAKANAKANQKTAERHLTSCSRRSQSAYRCPSPRTWVGCGRSEPETVWAGRRGPRPRRCGFPGRPGNRAVATHTHRQPTSPESQSDLNRNTLPSASNHPSPAPSPLRWSSGPPCTSGRSSASWSLWRWRPESRRR